MTQRYASVNRALVCAGLAGIVSVAAIAQQAPTFTRTVLQRGDISVPGREAVMGRADFPPGTATGKHTHFGEEVSYVLEGTMVLEVEGKPAVTLKAGDVFFVEAGRVHGAKNVSTAPAKVLATYVVEKGKPLTTAVP